MRLRFVHTLALMLLAAVLLAVLAMGGVMAWNLRKGFSDYLAARDVERLEQFAAFVGQRAAEAGGMDALIDHGVLMRELLHEFALHQGIAPPRRPPEPPQDEALSPPRDTPPPRGGAEAFGERVAIFRPDGQPWLGRPLPDDARLLSERLVQRDGAVVARVRMLKLPQPPDTVDARFLKSQYLGIAGVALGLLLLALVSAGWVARRWVRPLRAVQQATDRIARGDLAFRLPETRSDEIGDVMRNINRMAQGLTQLEAARRRWVADISHELRTPLAVLRGEIEALVDGVRPLQPPAMRSLHEEVLRLSALVDDLHLLALSDLKALPCYFEEADALALLRQVVQRFTLRAAQRGLTLHLDAPPARLPVHWDQRRIAQLLGNLLDNSLRYTDAPGRILIRLHPGPLRVGIEVADSAPGVPPADLGRVFEPLYRADAARSRHSGGSGLGLAICHAIVQAHRGSIRASASPLGGLCIHIELPTVAGDAP